MSKKKPQLKGVMPPASQRKYQAAAKKAQKKWRLQRELEEKRETLPILREQLAEAQSEVTCLRKRIRAKEAKARGET